MPRLRVAVDATPLHDARTGIGRFTHELLAGLAGHADIDPIAYAATWRGRDQLQSLVPPGVDVVARPMAARPLRMLWRRTDHPRIERWTGPIDVVHGTNYVVPPARAAQVVSVHDLSAWHFPELVTDDVRQYPGLVARAIERGAWVHTISDFVRDEILELLGADPERVVTVPLGLTPAPPGDVSRGRDIAGGPSYVVAIGTVEPRKDLPTLLRAFDLVAADQPDLRLVVAGRDGWGVEEYDAAVARTANRDRVVRVGFVDEATRGDLLAGAAALALSSRYEGFGLTVGEAMLASTPVVATSTGATTEVAGDAALLVPVGDAEALADGIARVVTEPALAADLVERGKQRAERFTWAATIDGLLGLWQRAAEAPRAGG